MAVPRKKKKTPPFDVTGIDFSVITTALETGGKMIEQIINGVQYGSPEVRLLMQEECELIIECRVCRGLFRALPNFIAHKRVYCLQPYCDFVRNFHFQTATSVVPPAEQPVVVEPTAPEDTRHPNSNQGTQQQPVKDKGKEAKKDKTVTGSASGATHNKTAGKSSSGQNKATTNSGNGSKSSHQTQPQKAESGNETVGAKTRSQQLDKTGDKCVEMLMETVHQIEAGQLGKSQEYAVYTAAVEKVEREKTAVANSETISLQPIASTPYAVTVSRGSVATDHTETPAAESQPSSTSGLEKAEKEKADSSIGGSAQPASNEPQVNKTASNTEPAPVSSTVRKAGPSKAAARNVAKVLRELRQKKKEYTAKEIALMKEQARKAVSKSGPSSSKSPPKMPEAAATGSEVSREDQRHPSVVSVRSSKIDDQFAVNKQDKEGSLRAVVKRCLTGRPGSVRVSPLCAKAGSGDWSSDVDSVSETGSHSDKGEASSLLVRQDSEGDQSIMDLETLTCKVCNITFSRKKSLTYHCQSRHSGQRTIFPCPYCPRVFYYFWGLTRHLNTNHKKSRSDIDRMRKGLRRKAYKQDIIEEQMTGTQPSSRSADRDAKDAPRKSRPSVAARKMVAVSKSSASSEARKNPAPVLYMPTRRRRVEVITSTNTKSKKSQNVYRKIYSNRRSVPTPTSPQTAGPLSPGATLTDGICRTRKIVAKALRTTRSKCVYNRTNVESPLSLPDMPRVIKQKRRNAKGQFLSKNILDVSEMSDSESSTSTEKQAEKDEPVISIVVPSSEGLEQSKPVDVTLVPQARDSTGIVGSVAPVAVSVQQKDSQPVIATSPAKVTVLVASSKTQPQTRTKTAMLSSYVPLTMLDTVQGQTAQTSPKTSSSSTVSVIKEVSPSQIQGKSAPAVSEAGLPTVVPSGLLHICPHCQRAFGRKISLDSHVKICSKAKPAATSSPAQSGGNVKSVHRLSSQNTGTDIGSSRSKVPEQNLPVSLGHQGKEGMGVGTRASTNKTGVKSQDVHTNPARTSVRNLLEGVTEKSEHRPSNLKSATPPQDSRLRSGLTVEKHHTGNDKVKNVSKTQVPSGSVHPQTQPSKESSQAAAPTRIIERPSRSRTNTESKASSSRESSTDSVRTRSSDTRLPQLPSERSSRSLRRDSESSRDSSLDGKSRVSSHEQANADDNLLTLSRQRLSEQLLVAKSSREKELTTTRPVAAENQVASSTDTSVMSKTTESMIHTRSAVVQTSPEKNSSQRTVTTTVLRKNLKAKLMDHLKKRMRNTSDSSVKPSSPQKQGSTISRLETRKSSAALKQGITEVQSSNAKNAQAPQKVQTSTGKVQEAQGKTVSSGNEQSLNVKESQSLQKMQSLTAKELQDPQKASSSAGREPHTRQKAQPSTSKEVVATQKTQPSTAKIVVTAQKAPSTGKEVVAAQKAPSAGKVVVATQKAPSSAGKEVVATQRAQPSAGKEVVVTQRTQPSISKEGASTQKMDSSSGKETVATPKVPTTTSKDTTAQKTQPSTGKEAVTTQKAQSSTGKEAVATPKLPSPAGKQTEATPEAQLSTGKETVAAGKEILTTQKVQSSTSIEVPAAPKARSSAGKELVATSKEMVAPQKALPLTSYTIVATQKVRPSVVKEIAATPKASSSTSKEVTGTSKVVSSAIKEAVETEKTQPLTGKEQEAPQGVQAAAGTGPKGEQLSQPQAGQQEMEVPQESGLSQRPRRKRRAPARVLDSEVTLPKSLASKKKPRIDPTMDHNDLSNDSSNNSPTESQGAAVKASSASGSRKTNQTGKKEEKDDEKSVSDVEEIWMYKWPGKPSEQVKPIKLAERAKSNRIYVVEPTQAGRITCQDTRKVEQIVDEAGLRCIQCKQRFTRLSSLRRHAIRHLGWKRYKCRLCRFCSYDRSECMYHILRSHPGRVRSSRTGGPRIDTYITDLNRQAASARSLKKQQTLDSRRKQGEGEEEEEKEKKSSSKPSRGKSNVEEIMVYPVPGSSSTPDSGTAITVHKPASSVERKAAPSSGKPGQAKPPSNPTFNISTRNSPRNFDTRPYTRNADQEAANTPQERRLPRQKVFTSSMKVTQFLVEEAKKASSAEKEKATVKITIKGSSAVPENIDVAATAQSGSSSTSSESHLPTEAAAATKVEKSMESPTLSEVQDLLDAASEEMPQESTEAEEEATIPIILKPISAEENYGFLMKKEDDSDLMRDAELQTLPELFMSDDEVTPVSKT